MKMVKTTGKGFRAYCQDYQKLRKSKTMKKLTRQEFVKKAADRWIKLDTRERQRYGNIAFRRAAGYDKTSSRRPSTSKRLSNVKKVQSARRRAISPTKQRAINKTYRRRSSGRLTPSVSRSRSIVDTSSYNTAGYSTTGYGSSTATGCTSEKTTTGQTSQTSLTSCATGDTSYLTSATSCDQSTERLPAAKEPAPSQKKPLCRPTLRKKVMPKSEPLKPNIKANQRTTRQNIGAPAEEKATSSHPRRSKRANHSGPRTGV